MTHATAHGIRTVATQELGALRGSARWRHVVRGWLGVLVVFVVLVRAVVGPHAGQDDVEPGITVFGGLILVMLVLLLAAIPVLATPCLRSRSTAGRQAETGAPAAADVALGQLAAVWAAALILLAAATPLVIATMLMGDVGLRRPMVAMGVIAGLAGVCTALVLCAADARRPLRGAYLLIAALVFGPMVAFPLGLAATLGEHKYSDPERAFDRALVPTGGVKSISRTKHGSNSAEVWWLLAPTPIGVLGDATPRARSRIDPDTNAFRLIQYDPLAVVRDVVRDARTTGDDFDAYDPYLAMRRTVNTYIEPAPSWPVGLAIDIALGAGAVVLRIRRLRVGTAVPTG